MKSLDFEGVVFVRHPTGSPGFVGTKAPEGGRSGLSCSITSCL